jgi:D-methionine transport system substrate-binding protein
MKKSLLSTIALAALLSTSTVSCSSTETVIKVAASDVPHAEILNSDAVKNAVKEKGYTLEVTVLDWTLQNDEVYNGTYDANYFQHRQYLQNWDSGSATYDESYEYQKLFPVAAIHSEPLRIYAGKSADKILSSSCTFVICNDATNSIRALDLLKANNLIEDYTLAEDGTLKLDDEGIHPYGLSNITLIKESLLATSLSDYDFGVLPTNSALTGNIAVDENLPVEDSTQQLYRANVLAASVTKYASDATYKTKIDVLTDVLLSSATSEAIISLYSGVVVPTQVDLR